MQVLGIPRSGFSLLMSSLDCLIPWDWDQRQKLQMMNEFFGKKLFINFFNEIPEDLSTKKIWSGEFNLLTGGPKVLDENYLTVRKYIGFIDNGDVIFEIKLNKRMLFLIHIFHSHYYNINQNNNLPTLLSRRNPCGIYESAIHSLNAMTSEYIQKKHSNLTPNDIEKIRNDIAIYKFSRKDVVEGLMRFQVDETRQMNEYVNNSKNCEIIDWEDLIISESDAFKKIYYFLLKNKIRTNELSSSKIKFYNNINKNLLAYHKHNYRAGHALRDGWVFGLPNIISTNLTEMINAIDVNNISIVDYSKHMRNLEMNKHILHENGSLASKVSNAEKEYELPIIDYNIKEFSMNKSNLDASNLKENHICDLQIGDFINIKKMSRELECLIPIFAKFDKEILKFNMNIEKIKNNESDSFHDLSSNLEFGNNLLEQLK